MIDECPCANCMCSEEPHAYDCIDYDMCPCCAENYEANKDREFDEKEALGYNKRFDF